MSAKSPSIFLVILIQAVSVAGDAFGQRCSRVHHKSSRRSFMITLSIVSSLQILLIFGILQLCLPSKISSAVYVGSDTIPCYYEVDVQGNTHIDCAALANSPTPCHQIPCRPQGPGTIWNSITLHPLLLLNGVLNIAYYACEVMLYREPLGLVFLVLASLFSSFLIRPVASLFHISGGDPVNVWVTILGIGGSLLCIFEKSSPPSTKGAEGVANKKSVDQDNNDHHHTNTTTTTTTIHQQQQQQQQQQHKVKEERGESSPSSDNSRDDAKEEEEATQPLLLTNKGTKERNKRCTSAAMLSSRCKPTNPFANKTKKEIVHMIITVIRRTLSVMVPFVVLSVMYALWFVAQKVFNDIYHVNLFGYTSLDQVTLPFFLFPFLLLIDSIPYLKKVYDSGEDLEHTFFESFQKAVGEANWLDLFIYRGFINGRACAYFYLAIVYDMNAVYLQLTLTRVILSWLASLVLVLLVPRFMAVTPQERKDTLNPINLILKFLGSAVIVVSLVLLKFVVSK